jgi:sirohydrochlorin cobaltochelatase
VLHTTVLLVGHGSREERANAEVESLASRFRAAHPELQIHVAYIELAQPLLAAALTELAARTRRIVIVPLFLFASGHVKNDLPIATDAARSRFPNTELLIAPCLGVHPTMVAIAWDRVAAAIPQEASARARTLLLVVGRGSSDPDANGDFCKLARLIGEGRGLFNVEATFLGISAPRTQQSLDLVARMRPDRVVVLPYLLSAGRLVSRLEAEVEAFSSQHPWIRASVTAHLGQDERLLDLIYERVVSALSKTSLLPCDTCHYRVPIGGISNQVGGLRALLYSVRHTFTHSQATMPVNLHRPLKKHVFVCGNADCAERGSGAVLDLLRRLVKNAGRTRDIKITRTSCMGRCGEGPSVAVYPDGIWYRGVRACDASEIVHEHLLEDRLVARLVDDILQ